MGPAKEEPVADARDVTKDNAGSGIDLNSTAGSSAIGAASAGGPITIDGARQNMYERVTTDLGTSPAFS